MLPAKITKLDILLINFNSSIDEIVRDACEKLDHLRMDIGSTAAPVDLSSIQPDDIAYHDSDGRIRFRKTAPENNFIGYVVEANKHDPAVFKDCIFTKEQAQ